MRCTFRTKWENNKIACVCTLGKKCVHVATCEELEFKLNIYDGIKDCMKERSYKKVHGAIKQK